MRKVRLIDELPGLVTEQAAISWWKIGQRSGDSSGQDSFCNELPNIRKRGPGAGLKNRLRSQPCQPGLSKCLEHILPGQVRSGPFTNACDRVWLEACLAQAEATRKANRCAGSACDLWRRLAHVVVALVGSIALRNGQTTYDGEMGERRQLGLCQSPLSRNAESAKPLTRGNCRAQGGMVDLHGKATRRMPSATCD